MFSCDTNVAVALGIPDGNFMHPDFTLLRGVLGVHWVRVCLTETVVNEIVGRYERTLATEIDKLKRPASPGDEARRARARAKVLSMVRYWSRRPEFARGKDEEVPLLKSAVDSFRSRLKGAFPVWLPTPDGAAEEGLRREIDRRLPAVQSGDGAGKGARDTVIWLTVLAAAKDLGYQLLYFVARDKGFGYPLHLDLQREADEVTAGNLVFYPDIHGLIKRLSSPTELPEDVNKMLAEPIVGSAIRYMLNDGNFRLELGDWLANTNSWVHTANDDELSSEPAQDEARVARIGEHTLVAVTRIWRVRRAIPAVAGQPAEKIEFTIKLSLLVTYTDGVITRADVRGRGGIYEVASDAKQ